MFYNQLEDLCKKNNLTVTAFLKKLGLSTSKGTAWKGGSIPKYDTLKLIADYFNVSISYLFEEEPNSKVISTIQGDNNGSNTVGYNIKQQPLKEPDNISKEMLDKFGKLEFNDKVKVMSLIAELNEKEGSIKYGKKNLFFGLSNR